MASFSQNGYYVDQPSDTLLRHGGDPCDVSAALDALNNLIHLADVSGQVFADWGIESGDTITTDASPYDTGGSSYLVKVWGGGPWAARTVPSTGSPYFGEPFSVRIEFAGAKTGGAGTITFYVVLQPGVDEAASRAAALAVLGGATRTNVLKFSTSSGTAAVLTPTPATNLLKIDVATFPRWPSLTDYAIPSLDGSNNADSTPIVGVSVDIYCTSSANGVSPTIDALYLCEFCK